MLANALIKASPEFAAALTATGQLHNFLTEVTLSFARSVSISLRQILCFLVLELEHRVRCCVVHRAPPFLGQSRPTHSPRRARPFSTEVSNCFQMCLCLCFASLCLCVFVVVVRRLFRRLTHLGQRRGCRWSRGDSFSPIFAAVCAETDHVCCLFCVADDPHEFDQRRWFPRAALS